MNNFTQNRQKLISAAIIGKPNAGKSTLLNFLVGSKISIVTYKAQTTRSMITGIVNIGDTQVILYDTPGICEAKRDLEKSMVHRAWSSIRHVDVVLLIIDVSNPLSDDVKNIIKKLKKSRNNIAFLLNKIDLNMKLSKSDKDLIENFDTRRNIFEISALNGKGIDRLIAYLKNEASESMWIYEEDKITTASFEFLISEIIREQLFLQLGLELPYNLTVENEFLRHQSDGSIKINQTIITKSESHKKIIIGLHGSMIKNICIKSRENIEKLFGKKVHLFLFVKVRPLWQNTTAHYQYMGLEYHKKT